jgi:long-chain acyl-CoA synthetase
MFLDSVARKHADKVAYRMAGSGATVTYRDLNRRTIQGANLLRSLRVATGECVLVHMDNNVAFLEVALACIRAGCYFVPAATYLKEPELLYIFADCGARVLVTTRKHLNALHTDQLPANIERIFLVDGPLEPFAHWQTAVAGQPDDEGESPAVGAARVYTSGTTGQPKGIRTSLTAISAWWRE